MNTVIKIFLYQINATLMTSRTVDTKRRYPVSTGTGIRRYHFYITNTVMPTVVNPYKEKAVIFTLHEILAYGNYKYIYRILKSIYSVIN